MSSIINTNLASLRSQKSLSSTQDTLNQTIGRLSSGKKINSAKDDAAGQAIANRMTANINASGAVSRDINDGISLMQTAEGGLDEINELVQRAHKLAVQASNGTLSDSDRAAINNEFHQIRDEVDLISRTTEIFGKYPLAPSPDQPANLGNTPPLTSVFPVSGSSGRFSSGIVPVAYIPAGAENFKLEIDSIGADDDIQLFTVDGEHLAGTPILGTNPDYVWQNQGVLDSQCAETKVLTPENGFSKTAQYDDSQLIQGPSNDDPNAPTSGNFAGMSISYSGDGDRNEPGADFNDGRNDTGGNGVDGLLETLKIDKTTQDVIVMVVGSGAFTAEVTWDKMPQPLAKIPPPNSHPTDIVMNAKFGQQVNQVTIPATPSDSHALGIDVVELDPVERAREALEKLKETIAKIDGYRGEYGALTNRFEGAIAGHQQEAISTSDARSRIVDADYAEETSTLLKASIIQNAGTAILAEANRTPSAILSLLQ